MRLELPEPSVVITLTLVGLMYFRAVDILRQRGRAIARSQQGCFWAAWTLTAIALIGPLDTYSADLVSVHMVQHILLADVAGPLYLMGLRSPVLVFFWPKSVLVTVAKSHNARRLWTFVISPPVALVIWLATLAAWHLPAAYELAHSSTLAHIAQHASFVLTGALVWWPLVDPARHRSHGGVWKALYLTVSRTLAGILATVMIVSDPLYPSYAEKAILYGTSAQADQQLAGVIMMSVDLFMLLVIPVTFILASAPAYEVPQPRDQPRDPARHL